MMKLFIWHGDDFLEDWSSGQITCIAKDLKSALSVIDEEMGYQSDSFPRDRPTKVIDLKDEKIWQEAWVTWGWWLDERISSTGGAR
ncbi:MULTISPECIES: hypothetical protein [unclassified Enterococcus]|uniref:hypothetical protein n=1 Tax=unclassified Enterococcus TaxID=2608891 RepID=UPI0015526295|nr:MULTISPECIES: hypothetical protein [unclassified Enterococcus]MBS7578390.1 hypothetical protein [Enterococcus sp. MMGLQ5-2]MBS7585621.1 hypothetical protein [Enterococcus sp. MMGLQ5-1]NPD13480.1 hypothetical protein [Enterococcus sp. MMGLQ5-1]NPD38222.1 hypothetical protein [Enterococcus sp. MMGLQ5-2]